MAGNAQHVRGRGFGRIDIDQFESVEVTRIDPVAIDQQRDSSAPAISVASAFRLRAKRFGGPP
jgi:hypothetical protein